MKNAFSLRLTLILPYFAIIVILATLLYFQTQEMKTLQNFLMTTTQQSQQVIANVQELWRLEEEASTPLLAFLSNPKERKFENFTEIDERIKSVNDQILPLLENNESKALFLEYLNSSSHLREQRNLLFEAILKNNSREKTSRFFAWELQSQLTHALLQDFQVFVTKMLKENLMRIETSREKMARAITSALILTLLISLLAWIFLQRSVLRRMNFLISDMETIKSGNFNHAIRIEGNDELSEMALTFDQLRHHLQSTMVSKDFLSSVIDSLEDGLFVFDNDESLSMTNPRALNFLNAQNLSQVESRKFEQILQLLQLREGDGLRPFHPLSPLKKRTLSKDFIVDHDTSSGPICRRILPHQEDIWLTFFSAPLGGPDSPSGFLVGLHDITPLKKTELALQKSSDELQRSNLELAQFSSVASHDLQEPLRKIVGFCRLLNSQHRDQLPPQGQEYLDLIVDGSHRMQTLIADLLDFSRVGGNQFPKTRVNTEKIIQQSLTLFEDQLSPPQGQVKLNGPFPEVLGTASELERVIQNLISNAIKYKSERPLKLEISVQRYQQSWIFSFQDNGIGIEQQNLEKIFVIFKRLHTRNHSPGTGLGLAICKKIIESHGGKIWAESELGKGSTIFFSLPMVLARGPEIH